MHTYIYMCIQVGVRSRGSLRDGGSMHTHIYMCIQVGALKGELEGWKLVAENAQMVADKAQLELKAAQRELSRLKEKDKG